MRNIAINLSKDIYEKLIHQLLPIMSSVRDSRPYHWAMNRKENAATALYILWMAGCCYWVYKIITISTSSQTSVALITDNPREALVYLFFGTFGLIFALLFTSYLFQFMYNMFHGGIHTLLSHQLHMLAKPVSYLILLYFAFVYIGDIKESSIKMYRHVDQLVHTARQKEIITNERSSGILKMLDAKTGQ